MRSSMAMEARPLLGFCHIDADFQETNQSFQSDLSYNGFTINICNLHFILLLSYCYLYLILGIGLL